MKMLKLIIICSLALTASMSAFSSCEIEVPKSWTTPGLTPGVDIKVDACKYKGGSEFKSDLTLDVANAFTTKVNSKLGTCKCDVNNKAIAEADNSKSTHCASGRSLTASEVGGETVIRVNSTVVPE